jgi:hypothetical protein
MRMRIIGGLGIAACLAAVTACAPDLISYALSGFDTPAHAAPDAEPKPHVIAASFTQEISAPSLRPSIIDHTGDVAQAEPVAAPAASPAQIQLGAYRAEAEAADNWNHLRAQTGALLSGLAPAIIAVDLPDKGRFYRLRVGLADRAAAGALCASLKSRGFACLAVKE